MLSILSGRLSHRSALNGRPCKLLLFHGTPTFTHQASIRQVEVEEVHREKDGFYFPYFAFPFLQLSAYVYEQSLVVFLAPFNYLRQTNNTTSALPCFQLSDSNVKKQVLIFPKQKHTLIKSDTSFRICSSAACLDSYSLM